MVSKKKEILAIWYRAIRRDTGAMWCESSDLHEVLEQSEGYEVDIHRMKVWRVVEPWEPMTSKQVREECKRREEQKRKRHRWPQIT